MKFQAKSFLLKNNLEVSIQICGKSDAEELIKTLKIYVGDSEYIPMNPDEFKLTVEEEEKYIQDYIDSENSILLVAKYKGKIVGNIDVTGSKRDAMKHTAMIGMGMMKEWRNIGLGKALMDCAINWAEQNPILEKLWLEVFADNESGMALYKKMWF